VTPDNCRLISRALVAGLVVAAVGLSACGRKGALEPPAATAKAAVSEDPDAPKDSGPEKPDRPFILDPLL